MILKNISILYGNNLKFIEKTNVLITNNTFQKINFKIKSAKDKIVDCDGLLLIPGLINSHTHVGDSIAKDIALDKDPDSKINPIFGIKQKILKETEPRKLIYYMRKTVKSMLKKGTTTFVDFREGGLDGVLLMQKALSNIPIRSIILGRIEYYQSKEQIKRNTPIPQSYQNQIDTLLKNCDGIGISGSNENSDSSLKQFSKIKKIRAIHCAETKQSYLKSKQTTRKTEPKRSGIPNVVQMMEMDCDVAIGTDNVMINSPDLFREMDFLWKATMGIHQKRIEPKNILKMVTVNAGKILDKKIGCIKEGYLADAVFIKKSDVDLDPLQNPHASIVHRANENSIQAVMIGGKIVHGKL